MRLPRKRTDRVPCFLDLRTGKVHIVSASSVGVVNDVLSDKGGLSEGAIETGLTEGWLLPIRTGGVIGSIRMDGAVRRLDRRPSASGTPLQNTLAHVLTNEQFEEFRTAGRLKTTLWATRRICFGSSVHGGGC
jgi:hypothetical protein